MKTKLPGYIRKIKNSIKEGPIMPKLNIAFAAAAGAEFLYEAETGNVSGATGSFFAFAGHSLSTLTYCMAKATGINENLASGVVNALSSGTYKVLLDSFPSVASVSLRIYPYVADSLAAGNAVEGVYRALKPKKIHAEK